MSPSLWSFSFLFLEKILLSGNQMDYKENVQEFLVSNTECSTNTTVQLREKLHSQEPSPFPKKCQSLKVFSLVIFFLSIFFLGNQEARARAGGCLSPALNLCRPGLSRPKPSEGSHYLSPSPALRRPRSALGQKRRKFISNFLYILPTKITR